jgi:hypothetical protein
MSKGEKFLSYGDRWELCWFFESSDAATTGERSGALTKREAWDTKRAAVSDPDGQAIERLELGEIRSKVRSILERVVADGPELAYPGSTISFTVGEDHVLELHEAYVLPGLIRGAGGASGVPTAYEDGERGLVMKLQSGAIIQNRNSLPVNCPPDAIPGLVCREGDGRVDLEARARLTAACTAYRSAREALGLPERGHEKLAILSAHAAQIAGVDRSTMGRAETLPKSELQAKAGAKTYTAISISSDDAIDVEKKEILERVLQKIREMTAESHARIAQFARQKATK